MKIINLKLGSEFYVIRIFLCKLTKNNFINAQLNSNLHASEWASIIHSDNTVRSLEPKNRYTMHRISNWPRRFRSNDYSLQGFLQWLSWKVLKPNSRAIDKANVFRFYRAFLCTPTSLPEAIAKSLIFRHLLPAIMFYRKCRITRKS